MPREFFARPSVPVAPDLLGCVLEHQTEAGLVAVELTEVEAYAGASDPASHAYRGKTARNAVMFGPPGHAYVYFTYGMYFCVNLVCLGNGSASAVLLRAGRIIEGEELARARRTGRQREVQAARGGRGDGQSPRAGGPSPRKKTVISFRDLARGPARLCQALDIDRSLDGSDVCVPDSPLRMRWPDASTTARSEAVLARGDDPAELSAHGGIHPPVPPRPPRGKILSGPRVGISAAAEVPWRFWIEGEPTVSVYRPAVRRRRKLVTP
ncbi:MAG: DNA-3-methyladenine glycosylase [Streptosporangiaceae bacterium]